MPRVTTASAAALALFLPIGRPLLVGLTPAVGIGAGLLTMQIAYAQTAEDWFESGLAKAKSGDIQGAIADYTKAIEIYPSYAWAYYTRGNAKLKLKDYQGSIADFTKAIQFQHNYYHAITNRGVAFNNLGDLKSACRDWKTAEALGDTKPIEWIRNRC